MRVLLAIFIFFCLTFDNSVSHSQTPCEDLQRLSLRDEAFNREVAIVSATVKQGSATVPTHCEVRGVIWPEINFVVKMPVENWNERFYMTASGAAAGVIPEAQMNRALAKGFAVAGTDTGHKGTSVLDWTWASPDAPYRDQKIKDYFYRANHETVLVAKSLIRAYYGVLPKYSYWEGCSGAGRAGLTIAQRYPRDFDGYVIGAANRDYVIAILDMLWLVRQGKHLSPSKIPLIGSYVYEKCDILDGVKDGLIEDPRACKFDPISDLPACPNDVDGSTCFTTAERIAIKRIYEGLPSGKMPMPLGSEVCTDPTNPATSGWQIYVYAPAMMYEGFLKYMVYGDPNYDVASFNFDTDMASAISTEIARLGNLGQQTDLSALK
ncbi:MAG: tannase/feruloyl esterase family alpha/beta hydrolase, partial [candidate division WOR-3 bacterium]